MKKLLAFLLTLTIWSQACAQQPAIDSAVRDLIRQELEKQKKPTRAVSVEDLGCRPNDPTFQGNAGLINSAIKRIHNGQLRAAAIEFPSGDWFTFDDIYIPPGMGIDLEGWGISYRLGEANYLEDYFKGVPSRVIRMNGGNVLRFGSAYSGASKLVLQGRRIPGKDTSGTGPKATGILCEGRALPATSKLTIDRCAFIDCGTAIDCSNEPDNTHADTISVTNCVAQGIDTWLHSSNQQAMGFYFAANEIVNDGHPLVVYDLEAGGRLKDDALQLNHPDFTLLRLGPGNHNNRRFDIHLWIDTPVGRKLRATFLECTHPNSYDLPSGNITGLAAVMPEEVDATQFLKLNGGKHNFKFDITNVEVK
jgi:hypothetical protein